MIDVPAGIAGRKVPGHRFPVGAGSARDVSGSDEPPKLAGKARSHRGLLALLLACACTVAPAFALATDNPQPTTSNPDLIDNVAARIQTAQVLHGDFAQQRTLAGFAKPLRSSGSFIAARERGVLWTTTTPFPGELVITDEQIRERVDGQDSVVLDASSEPALRQINRVLLTLLQGDLGALREHFTVAGNSDAKRWRLDLTPLGQLGEAIASIELTGSTQVESVVIHERNGDSSRIDFSALRTAEALTATEAARFD